MMFGFFRKKVRVRMAPSPTGRLHIGTARAALFNYLYAKKHAGTFILRLEDTDRERSRAEYEEDIVSGLSWLGLSWDEYYRQSERTEVYRAAVKRLIDRGAAYVSKESAKDDHSRMVEVVRLRNPKKTVAFEDMLRGNIATNTADLGDFVIARSLDDPLFHLAVVVDDGNMGITHVIRGEDHIPNTARQILIMEALGYPRPRYVHLPLILAPDRSKLSKRHGATGVAEYRALGYLPEALCNYLALLGWNPGNDKEFFTLEALVAEFDLARLHKAGAVFDIEKLRWFNREYLKRLSRDEFRERLSPFLGPERAFPDSLLPLLQERASTLRESAAMFSSEEFAFMRRYATPERSLLMPRSKEPVTADRVRAHLSFCLAALDAVPASSFTAHTLKEKLWDYATREGRGVVLWPLRVALSGAEKSPDPFLLAELLGKDETLGRLKNAISIL